MQTEMKGEMRSWAREKMARWFVAAWVLTLTGLMLVSVGCLGSAVLAAVGVAVAVAKWRHWERR